MNVAPIQPIPRIQRGREYLIVCEASQCAAAGATCTTLEFVGERTATRQCSAGTQLGFAWTETMHAADWWRVHKISFEDSPEEQMLVRAVWLVDIGQHNQNLLAMGDMLDRAAEVCGVQS